MFQKNTPTYYPAYQDDSHVRRHYQSIPVATVIPFIQASLSGVILGAAAGVLAAVFEYVYPWRVFWATWAIVQALAWLLLLSRWAKLINRLELALGVDLDQDGRIGTEDRQQPVRVEVIEDGGRHGIYAQLPATEYQLATLARGLLQDNQTLADQVWTGKGRPFDRPTFTALKNELLARGLASWNSPGTPARGLHLTKTGTAVFRYFLNTPALSGVQTTKRTP